MRRADGRIQVQAPVEGPHTQLQEAPGNKHSRGDDDIGTRRLFAGGRGSVLWDAGQRIREPALANAERSQRERAIRGSSTSEEMIDYSTEIPPEREFKMRHYQSVNPELLGLAKENLGRFAKPLEKQAFVPGGDPAAMGGDPAAGGMPPGGDPMAGGMPPGGDPMAGGMPPGGDPMAGGMPPGGDPMAGGGDPMAAIQPMIQQAVQQAMAGAGGGMGGGAGAGGEGAIKPKIDVNVEIMQMKKLLAKIADGLGIQIPAAEMVATPEDLTQMAQGGPGAAAMDTGGAPGGSAISPIEPMAAAVPTPDAGIKTAAEAAIHPGTAFDPPKLDTSSLGNASDKAAAILSMRSQRVA